MKSYTTLSFATDEDIKQLVLRHVSRRQAQKLFMELSQLYSPQYFKEAMHRLINALDGLVPNSELHQGVHPKPAIRERGENGGRKIA